MIDEARRRACLQAMQIDVWLPRTALPHAAPSRPAVLEALALPPLQCALPQQERRSAPARPPASPVAVDKAAATPASAASAVPARAPVSPAARLAQVLPIRPAQLKSETTAAQPKAERPAAPAATPRNEPPPRFSLQLLRAGHCLLVVQLPTGAPLGQRDPASRLLSDLLRAAGLPPEPQPCAAPLRWPLLRSSSGHFDQGPQGARDFVHTLLLAQLELQPARVVWLVGDAADRFSGVDGANHLPGAGFVWRLPGLDELMEQPGRKRGLWQDMQRVMARWTTGEQ